MKKFLSIVIIAISVFALVGCSSDDNEKKRETVKENKSEHVSSEKKEDEEIVIEGNGTDITYIGNVENKSNDVSFILGSVKGLDFVVTYTFDKEEDIFAFNTNIMEKGDCFYINILDAEGALINIEYDNIVKIGSMKLEEYLQNKGISAEDMWFNDNVCVLPIYDERGLVRYYDAYMSVLYKEENYVVKLDLQTDRETLDKEYVQNILSKLFIEATIIFDSTKYYYEDIIALYLKDTYDLYIKEPVKLKTIGDYISYYDGYFYYIELENSMEDDSVYVGTYKGKRKIYYSKEEETYYIDDGSGNIENPLYIAIQLDSRGGTFELDEFTKKFLN